MGFAHYVSGECRRRTSAFPLLYSWVCITFARIHAAPPFRLHSSFDPPTLHSSLHVFRIHSTCLFAEPPLTRFVLGLYSWVSKHGKLRLLSEHLNPRPCNLNLHLSLPRRQTILTHGTRLPFRRPPRHFPALILHPPPLMLLPPTRGETHPAMRLPPNNQILRLPCVMHVTRN